MKLIAILIALAGVHYLPFMQSINRYAWFRGYAEKIQSWLIQLDFSWASIAAMVLPLLLVLSLIQMGFEHWLWGLVSIVIDIVVLWYCLSPENLETKIETSASNVKIETQHANITVDVKDTAIKIHHEARADTRNCLTHANENIFAVIFWFLLLGAFGAFLYRCVSLVRQNAELSPKLTPLVKSSRLIQAVLDWIPARLTALSYVLAGDFVKGFAEWSKDAFSGLQANSTVLIRTGLAACGFNVDSEMQADIEESRAILRMVDRATIVWLALIAIFTLGAWIY